jgi:molybdopterin adenylyltransferase
MASFRAGILTISDSAYRGERADEGGPLIRRLLHQGGHEVLAQEIVPDEQHEIAETFIAWTDGGMVDVIISTGGTGLSPRDVTPEATRSVIEREVPGIVEAVRLRGLEDTPRAMLSRAVAGIRRQTLIVNLPGSPAAVQQGMEVLLPVLRHALKKIKGDQTPCSQA